MKLEGTTWDHPRGYDSVVAASKVYAARTGVEIEWTKRSLQAFADAPISKLADQSDLIILDHPHIGQICENDVLLALPNDLDAGASLGGSQESYFWGGKCWAYALDAACQMLAYRPDWSLERPTRWEQFVSADRTHLRPLTPLAPVDAFDTFLTLVAGRGEIELPFGADRFVSDENGIYALDILRAIYQFGPDEQLEMNPIDVLEVLTSEDEFAFSPCLFGYVNYARSDFRRYRVAYDDLPVSAGFDRSRPILGGAGIGVSAKTSAPEAAIDFARWICSEPVQSGVFLENHGQPAHRHSWLSRANDPDVAGFFAGGFRSMENAWTRPRDSWFLGFVDEICAIMPDFFRKRIAAADFLEHINALYRDHARSVELCR